MPVQDVLFNDTRSVGMVVLAAGTSQAQLEALEPDLELLQSQLGDKHLNGVAVTCQGMPICPRGYDNILNSSLQTIWALPSLRPDASVHSVSSHLSHAIEQCSERDFAALFEEV